jgi:DNA-binding transcriptional LysR family regulator
LREERVCLLDHRALPEGGLLLIERDEAPIDPTSVAPRIEMEIASNETIKQAVAAGFGLGFLSGHAVQQELALGRLAVVPVKGVPFMRQWYVVHRRSRTLPRIAEAFERFVVEEGARHIQGPRSAVTRGRRR